MKVLTASIIAWVVLLCCCTYLSNSRDEPSDSKESEILSTEPTPEFSDLSIDETGSGPQMIFSPVFNGTSWICRSEKSEFETGKALVLYRRSNNFSLERSSVVLGMLKRSELSAAYPVKFRGSKEALFLLSDQGNLTPGPVETAYLQPWNTATPDDELFFDGLRIGDRRTYEIGENQYTVRVSTGPSSQGGPVAVLVLENREQKQMIWYGTLFDLDQEVGELGWVGDLDHDKHLDLLFKYFEKNGGGSVDVLFLSSYAVSNNLVGPAAFSFARDCH